MATQLPSPPPWALRLAWFSSSTSSSKWWTNTLRSARGRTWGLSLVGLGLLAVVLVAPASASSGWTTNLQLTSTSACVVLNGSFTLLATLRNTTGLIPITNQPVTFQYAINASSYANLKTQNTNSSGETSITYTAKYNGSYLFRAVFLGASGVNSSFFSPGVNLNGSISQTVLVQTSNLCGQQTNCGLFGFGCFFANPLGSIGNALGSLANGFSSFFGGAVNTLGAALSGALNSIGGAFASIGYWINPLNWLNALGLGFIYNGFVTFVNIFLFLIDIVLSFLPYVGFIMLMIHVYYIVRFDFEGLFGFWEQLFGIVAMVGDAIFNFVQIILDLVSSVGSAGGGAGMAAAGA